MTSVLLLASLSWGAEHPVVAVPAAVTVFADRARVTRTVALNLPRGRQEVVFEGLPANTYRSGVTADARGPGQLLGVDMKRVTATEVADVRVKEIDAELQRLRDRRQDVIDGVSAAKAELSAVATARVQAARALSNQLLVASRGPDRAKSLRTTLAAQERRALEMVRKGEVSQREVDEQIAALQRERSSLGSSGTDTWSAVVHLDLTSPGRVDLDLSYMVPGATWRPKYDLRGDAAGGKVELSLSAVVSQRTGEDWKGVKLTVSSARPSQGTVVPELDPFFLNRPVRYNRSRPAPAKPAAARGAMAMDMEEAAAPPPAPEPEPMEVATAQVEVQMSATAFTVKRPEDIDSDGTERKTLLTTESLAAELRHVTAPRVDPAAYLVGEVKNTTTFPLLAGQAGVFLEGAYLGDFSLQTVPPGAEFDIAFGADDRVRVERIPVEIVKDGKGGLGKRDRSEWTWRIEVRNSHRRAIDMEVWEQIPVSTRQDVQVELKPATGAEPKLEDGGLVKFEYKINPGTTHKLTWGYQIEYPSDLVLGWME